MPGLPVGSIVETNCVFSNGMVCPVTAAPLPSGALGLAQRCCASIDLTCEGIRERDFDKLFAAFMSQSLCRTLRPEAGYALFREMCGNTWEYISDYYPQLQ